MSYELNAISEKIPGEFIYVYEGESNAFSFKEEFEKSGMEKNCTISAISAKGDAVVLELKKWEHNMSDMNCD